MFWNCYFTSKDIIIIMAHFAEINDKNIVQRVIVIHNNVLISEDGTEEEHLGIEYCKQLFGGNWIQTSYNHNFRKMYAGIGYKYIPEEDIFIPGNFSSGKEFDEWLYGEKLKEEQRIKVNADNI